VNPLWRGNEITVAIIGSGISRVRDLDVMRGYSTFAGQPRIAWDIEENGHGTHCAGITAVTILLA
jgi:subtilisin family serine protease